MGWRRKSLAERRDAMVRDLPSTRSAVIVGLLLLPTAITTIVREALPLIQAGAPMAILAIVAYLVAPAGFATAGAWMRAAHRRRYEPWFRRAQVVAGLSALAILAAPLLIVIPLATAFPTLPPELATTTSQNQKLLEILIHAPWFAIGFGATGMYVVQAPTTWREFRRVESLLAPSPEERAARGDDSELAD